MKPTKRSLLTEFRKSVGTQEVVAKELKISRQYLGMMETGTRDPSTRLMIRMEQYFGIPANKLFPDLFFNQKSHVTLQNQIA